MYVYRSFENSMRMDDYFTGLQNFIYGYIRFNKGETVHVKNRREIFGKMKYVCFERTKREIFLFFFFIYLNKDS